MVSFQGEEPQDHGRIIVVDNLVLYLQSNQFRTLAKTIGEVSLPKHRNQNHDLRADAVNPEDSEKIVNWLRNTRNLSLVMGIHKQLDSYIEQRFKEV